MYLGLEPPPTPAPGIGKGSSLESGNCEVDG